MRQLTPDGRRIVEDLAQRYGFGTEAVTAMLYSVAAGGGSMAQFDHPEFGGMGQWSQGGMTMIGDMFNNALKARVDGLCAELAGALGRQLLAPAPSSGQFQSQGQQGQSQGGFGGGVSLFVAEPGRSGGSWWPNDLGYPSSTGAQNDIRYAVFPGTRRLAIEIGGALSVYDTLDHSIGGVSQQQGGDASLSFTSQYGLVRVADLPIVSGRGASRDASRETPAPVEPSAWGTSREMAPETQPFAEALPSSNQTPAQPSSAHSADDIFAMLERLAGLRDKGILSEEEFAAKKAELLARL